MESDTEAKGLREVIGEDTTDLVLKGCNVHWIRSYQRVVERVNSSVFKGNKRIAVEAFYLIAKHIMIVTEKQHVLQLFDVLHDTGKLSLIKHLSVLLSSEQIAVISKLDYSQVQETGWSGGQGQATYKC